MNKNLPQDIYNQSKYEYKKKRDVTNPKKQKRKQQKAKKLKEKYKENQENHPKENIEENKNYAKYNDNGNNNQKGKENNKEESNKDINELKYNEIRYFGKNITNLSSFDERKNQHILNSSEFAKLNMNNNNLFFINTFNNNSAFDEILNLISIKHVCDPQYVIQYRKDIFLTLLREEKNNCANYSLINNIIDEDTRLKYILFLIQVCDRITNREEIHYLSINIFDRVLTKYSEKKKRLDEKTLQLICFCALFIAYKYETGYYFLIDDLIKHTEDSLVTKAQILKFENVVHSLLDFDYLIVYPSDFLKHYELIDDINSKKVYYFCLYLIDFILSDIKLMSYKKSLIAASCYYIAKANLINNNTWPNIFQFVTGYTKDEVKDLAVKIIKEMKNTKNSSIFKCLKKKYTKDEYFNISDAIFNKKK